MKVETKAPFTDIFVRMVCVWFFVAKSMQRMGSCVSFCCRNIFLRTKSGEGSPRSALSSFVAVAAVE